MAFTGIPFDAVHFYQQLEEHNTKEWFQAHKAPRI